MSDTSPIKEDPDGPPAYDETTSPPADFVSDPKKEKQDDLRRTCTCTSSTSSSQHGPTYSLVVSHSALVALDANPPRYAAFTIHSWNRLRFVNFPQSVLEAIDHVARAYYLNGVGWEFEYGQWTLKTNAKAFLGADGNAGKYLLTAVLTRLSQFGYIPQSSLFANSPAYLDKDSYFFRRSDQPLSPPPPSVLTRLKDATTTTTSAPPGPKAGIGGMLSKLSTSKDKDKSEERLVPDLSLLQSFDHGRYHPGKRHFCLSIWRSDRMTILGCPDDNVLEAITSATAQAWPSGIELVSSTFFHGWTWIFKGKPWSVSGGLDRPQSKLFLCTLLDELDSKGWRCVMGSRFTRDEGWRDYDTWYFASSMS